MTCLVSLAMIVCDEERHVARALASVSPFVDEMVVVDTGSSDSTVDIAKRCGARVAHFAWADDFSAARNFALRECVGKMRLVLDADEQIVDGGESLRAWARERPKIAGVAQCVNTFDQAGIRQEQADLTIRLLPHSWCYEGSVHEQPVGTGGVEHSPLVIAHDGYVNDNLARKRGRNAALLKRELDLRPNDGYLWYQFGVALMTDGAVDEAREAFDRSLRLTPGAAPHRHPLVVRRLTALGADGRFDEARHAFAEGVQEWPESPDVYFVMADVLLNFGVANPGAAEAVVPIIRDLLRRCLEIGERPDLPGSVIGRGSSTAAHNLSLIEEGMD